MHPTKGAGTITTALRSARLARDLRQRDLAEMLGITQPAVAHYESGASRGTWRVRRMLESIFDVPASVLLAPENANGDDPQEAAAASSARAATMKDGTDACSE